MIFTECTNEECGEPIVVHWESGDGYGFIRHECEKCKCVSFVECTSLGGVTLPEKDFWEKHPDAKKSNPA